MAFPDFEEVVRIVQETSKGAEPTTVKSTDNFLTQLPNIKYRIGYLTLSSHTHMIQHLALVARSIIGLPTTTFPITTLFTRVVSRPNYTKIELSTSETPQFAKRAGSIREEVEITHSLVCSQMHRLYI